MDISFTSRFYKNVIARTLFYMRRKSAGMISTYFKLQSLTHWESQNSKLETTCSQPQGWTSCLLHTSMYPPGQPPLFTHNHSGREALVRTLPDIQMWYHIDSVRFREKNLAAFFMVCYIKIKLHLRKFFPLLTEKKREIIVSHLCLFWSCRVRIGDRV